MAAEPLGVWGADSDVEARLRAVPTSTHPAFDDLYREHYDRLRRFVLGMTGRETVAEDIAQETLLRAYIRIEKLDFDRPLWPWLKQVATRLVYDHTRSDREICLDEPEPAVAATEDVADRLAEQDMVARVLRRLPARQRAAVTLRYLEDWKAGELADLFSLPRPAVEQLLLRARRSLSAEYRRLGGDRLRIALWPVFALLARLRDRASRFAANAGHAGSTSIASAVDATTQVMVAVVVGSGLITSGVAMAHTVSDRPLAAAAAKAVEVKSSAAEEHSARVLASRETEQAAVRRASAATPRGGAGDVKAPDATRKVELAAPGTPLDQSAAEPEARASSGREDEKKVATRGQLKVGTSASAAGTEASVTAEVWVPVDCVGATGDAACQAYDAAAPAIPQDQ